METIDRNKSAATHNATATAAMWLDGIGCKPVETEVAVGPGWVADLASFWSPTYTEAKLSKFLQAMCHGRIIQDTHEEFSRLSRRLGGRFTILLEVKTTRADFLNDVGRKYGTFNGKTPAKRAALAPQAHLQIVAGPPAVFADDRLESWGKLLLSADCKQVRKFDGMWYYNAMSPEQIEDLIAGVACRRDNNTRYGSIRRAMKSYRAGCSPRHTPGRVLEQLRKAKMELRLWKEMFPSPSLWERLKRERDEALAKEPVDGADQLR